MKDKGDFHPEELPLGHWLVWPLRYTVSLSFTLTRYELKGLRQSPGPVESLGTFYPCTPHPFTHSLGSGHSSAITGDTACALRPDTPGTKQVSGTFCPLRFYPRETLLEDVSVTTLWLFSDCLVLVHLFVYFSNSFQEREGNEVHEWNFIPWNGDEISPRSVKRLIESTLECWSEWERAPIVSGIWTPAFELMAQFGEV